MKRLIYILSFTFFLINTSFANNNFIFEGTTVAATDTGRLFITMENDFSVNGLNLIIQFDPTLLTPLNIQSLERAAAVSSSDAYRFLDNQISFISYDNNGDYIAADSGRIFEVTFIVNDSLIVQDTTTQLEFLQGTVADSSLAEIAFDYQNGGITISTLNHAPLVVNPIPDTTQVEDSGTFAVFDLSQVFNDMDGDSLIFSVAVSGNSVTASIDSVLLNVSTVPDSFGTSTVVASANDGALTISDTFEVTILPINDAPVLENIPNIAFDEDDSTVLKLNQYVTDVDDDTSNIQFSAIVISATAQPAVAKFASRLPKQPNRLKAPKVDDVKPIREETEENPALSTSRPTSLAEGTSKKANKVEHSKAAKDFASVSESDRQAPKSEESKMGKGEIKEKITKGKANRESIEVLGNEFLESEKNIRHQSLLKPEQPIRTYTFGSRHVLLVGTGDLIISIDTLTNIATFRSTMDSSGQFTVVFTATDTSGASDDDTLQVLVNPVNDPPSTFSLLQPFDGDTLAAIDSIQFLWNASRDVDNDSLTYALNIFNAALDTTINGIIDTTFMFNGDNVLLDSTAYQWQVAVTDGFFMVASNDIFTFITCTEGFWGNVTPTDTLANSTDALIILTYDVGLPLSPEILTLIDIGFGDVNVDGITNSTDALFILSYDVGISLPFPVGDPVCLPGGSNPSPKFAKPTLKGGESIGISAKPSSKQIKEGMIIDIPVIVNMTNTSEKLGSYTADLKWDPQVFDFEKYSGGTAKGFENPVVNENEVEKGKLRFAHAYPFGADGEVNILNVQLKVIAKNGSSSSISLNFSAMTAAETFVELLPYLQNDDMVMNLEFEEIPSTYSVVHYPNPFNPVSHIRFGLPQPSRVKIVIFNVLGEQVETLLDAFKPAGYHTIDFDGSGLASGTYFYRIQAGNFIEVKKMILMK